jgi:hypothetical protein
MDVMEQAERVVVTVRARTFFSDVARGYAAEIAELGLGVYAETPKEAQRKLRAVLVDAIQTRRQLGRLVAWLDRSGITWSWERDYNGPLPVIDGDDLFSAEDEGPSDHLMVA